MSKKNNNENKKQSTESMVVLTREKHEEKFPRKKSFIIKNKSQTPVSINLCHGKDKYFFVKEENIPRVNKNIKDPCKTCPGMSERLIGSEKKKVNVVMPECLHSDHLETLIQNKAISVFESVLKKVKTEKDKETTVNELVLVKEIKPY